MQRSRKITGPIISVALYRPKRGKAKQLLGCVKDHLPTLRAQKLVTARQPIIMRAKGGTIVEVFEWKSEQSIDDAHHNPQVIKLWMRFNACCTYGKLNDLAERSDIFPGFEPVKLRS